jgi:hypothetical protein
MKEQQQSPMAWCPRCSLRRWNISGACPECGTVLQDRCWCGRPRGAHCDMDEPGLDHPYGCEKAHHEFKPGQRPVKGAA